MGKPFQLNLNPRFNFSSYKMRTPIESVCWRALVCSEAPASLCASAASYGLSKDVGVVAIVVTELKLGKIQRQIFLADIVVGAHDSALQQRPEAFDVVRMNLSAHVFVLAMIDGLVPETPVDVVISAIVISCDQRDFFVDRMVDESSEGPRICFADHLADDVAFALNCADHSDLAVADGLTELLRASGIALLAALFAPVPITVLAADVGLIHFHDSHQLPKCRVFHSGPQAHAHIPSGVIRAGSEHPMELQSADAFLAGQHQIQNLEPHEQGLFRLLKDGLGLE